MFARTIAIFPLLVASLVGCNEVTPIETAEAVEVSADGSSPEMAPETVLASWDGGQVTWADVEGQAGGELQGLEVEYLTNRYQLLQQATESMMVEAMLEAKAAEAGTDIEGLLTREITNNLQPPTDEEIQAFYDEVAPQLRGATLEEVSPYLSTQLMEKKQGELFAAYMEGLKAEYNASMSVPFPDLPRIEVEIADHDYTKGPDDAPVTLIEFADFQCPHCARVSPTLARLVEEYDGKVRLVFKDFPLDGHPRAMYASIANHCAGDQGKYWEMHQVLWDHQRSLEDADLTGYATELGLDVDAWTACYTARTHEDEIQEDIEHGTAAGVSGTPAVFVNGILVSGALPYEHFAEMIDRELGQ